MVRLGQSRSRSDRDPEPAHYRSQAAASTFVIWFRHPSLRGNRLAELQLRILWEEILVRFPMIEVVGNAKRVYSNFIHGFKSMPVRIPA